MMETGCAGGVSRVETYARQEWPPQGRRCNHHMKGRWATESGQAAFSRAIFVEGEAELPRLLIRQPARHLGEDGAVEAEACRLPGDDRRRAGLGEDAVHLLGVGTVSDRRLLGINRSGWLVGKEVELLS